MEDFTHEATEDALADPAVDRDGDRARRTALVDEAERILAREQGLERIDALLALRIVERLVADEVSAAEMKVAMDYLKMRNFQPTDVETNRRLQGARGGIDDLVDWNALHPGVVTEHEADQAVSA